MDFRATINRVPTAMLSRAGLPPPFADEEVRRIVVGRFGEGFAVSYLDQAAWDADARELTPKTLTAYDKLRRDLQRELTGASVTLVDPKGVSAGTGVSP
jgi:hypothetical protein